jgi:hypothetical protein
MFLDSTLVRHYPLSLFYKSENRSPPASNELTTMSILILLICPLRYEYPSTRSTPWVFVVYIYSELLCMNRGTPFFLVQRALINPAAVCSSSLNEHVCKASWSRMI